MDLGIDGKPKLLDRMPENPGEILLTDDGKGINADTSFPPQWREASFNNSRVIQAKSSSTQFSEASGSSLWASKTAIALSMTVGNPIDLPGPR